MSTPTNTKFLIKIIHYEDEETRREDVFDYFEQYFPMRFTDCEFDITSVDTIDKMHDELNKSLGTQIPPFLIFDLRDDHNDDTFAGFNLLKMKLDHFRSVSVNPVIYSAWLDTSPPSLKGITIRQYLLQHEFSSKQLILKGEGGVRRLAKSVDHLIFETLKLYKDPVPHNVVGYSDVVPSQSSIHLRIYFDEQRIHNRSKIFVDWNEHVQKHYKLRFEIILDDGVTPKPQDTFTVKYVCEFFEIESQSFSIFLNEVNQNVSRDFTISFKLNNKNKMPEQKPQSCQLKLLYYHNRYLLGIQYVDIIDS